MSININNSIGMKRGTVYLEDHKPEWETAAAETIRVIKSVLGGDAVGIRHVGSTSIRTIPAKPIIDIAVGVEDFGAVLSKKDELEAEDIIFRFDERPEQLLFVMGDFEKDTRTHHIHVVRYGSAEWENYLNFSDYLNANAAAAERYAALKKALAKQYPNDRTAYTDGKSELINALLEEARGFRKSRGLSQMVILNIHGYKGTPRNAAYSALCELSEHVISPEIDHDAERPEELFDRLLDICLSERVDMVVGTSLGGFYAAVAAAKLGKPLLLVNPCLKPQAVIPALGYEGDVSRFEKLSESFGKFDLARVRCIIGGKDEIIGDHTITKELLGAERVTVIPDGMHSGATLALEEHFPEMVRAVMAV